MPSLPSPAHHTASLTWGRVGWAILSLALMGAVAWGLASCARVAPPSGGLKDTLAPRLLTTVPRMGSTNYRGNRVLFEFSEQVTLEQFTRQFVVSPPLEPGTTVTPRVRGRRVELTFSEPLPPGRTYNLNLRRAVVDVTESNPADGVRLVFSTGPTLDTLSLNGVVRRLISGAVTPDVTVALWPASDTLDITRQRALYVTRTNTEGAFTLENLPDSTFFIAALDDGNNNLRWDGRREPLAFVGRQSRPSALGSVALELSLSVIDDTPPRVTRARLRPDSALEVTFSEGVRRAEVRVPARQRASTADSLLPVIGGSETTDIVAYLMDRPAGGLMARPIAGVRDSVTLRVLALDSAYLPVDTLIGVSLTRPRAAGTATTERRGRQTEEPTPAAAPGRTIAWQLEGAGGGATPLPTRLTLTLGEPPSRWATYVPELRVRRDTLSAPRLVPASALRRPTTGFAGQYIWELRPMPEAGLVAGGRAEVLLPGGGLTHTGARIKGDTLALRLMPEEQTGLIRGRVRVTAVTATPGQGGGAGIPPQPSDFSGPFVVMIYDSRGKLLDERAMATPGPFEFSGLPAGSYQIQVLEDANGNRRWDPGSYRANRQPERLRPPIPVQLKANWEVELEDGAR